jgi:hypothetical protein
MLDSAVDDGVESAGAAISGSALERDGDREIAISLLSFSLSDVAGVDRVILTVRVAKCEELSSKRKKRKSCNNTHDLWSQEKHRQLLKLCLRDGLDDFMKYNTDDSAVSNSLVQNI